MSDKTKPNFNNGYIKASPEAYDLLIKLYNIAYSICLDSTWLYVEYNTLYETE